MKEIYSALIKAQSQFPIIEKASTVNAGKFNFKYASYSDICAAIRKPLADNCLAFIHTRSGFGCDEHGKDTERLFTILIHESGEQIETSQPVPNITDAQQYGAWLTYMRRYQLSALLGLATDDDVEGEGMEGIGKDEEPAPAWSEETKMTVIAGAETLGVSVPELLKTITKKDVKKIDEVPVAWEAHILKTIGEMIDPTKENKKGKSDES